MSRGAGWRGDSESASGVLSLSNGAGLLTSAVSVQTDCAWQLDGQQ
jgi:hypothetical protein